MNDHHYNTDKPFTILSIEKTDPPENVSGGEWYRFTIEHKTAQINGFRSGTLRSVKKHLEEYVETLNTRAALGYSAYAAKKVKK